MSRIDSCRFRLLLGCPGIAGARGPQEQNGHLELAAVCWLKDW